MHDELYSEIDDKIREILENIDDDNHKSFFDIYDLISISEFKELYVEPIDNEYYGLPRNTITIKSSYNGYDYPSQINFMVAVRPDNSILIRKDITSITGTPIIKNGAYRERNINVNIKTNLALIETDGNLKISYLSDSYDKDFDLEKGEKAHFRSFDDMQGKPDYRIIKLEDAKKDIIDVCNALRTDVTAINDDRKEKQLIRLCLGR